jgi:hypothetical protein
MKSFTCHICGEAIPSVAISGTNSIAKAPGYTHWLECSQRAVRQAHEILNAPVPVTANAGYGLRFSPSSDSGRHFFHDTSRPVHPGPQGQETLQVPLQPIH